MSKRLCFVVLGTLLFFTGCTKSTFFFTFADKIAYWKMDNFLDLSSDQSGVIKAATKNSFHLIKKDFLPEVAAQLRSSESQLRSHFPNSEADAMGFINAKDEAIHTLSKKFWTIIKPQVQTGFFHLDAHNWQSFKTEMAKRNQKLIKIGDKCADQTQEWVEYWIGSLNEDQISRISSYCKQASIPLELQVKNREHEIDQFAQTSEIAMNKYSSEKMVNVLDQWFRDQSKFQLPEYVERKALRNDQLKNLLQWFLLHLTDKQKKSLLENISNQADNLEKISRKEN